MVVAGNEERSDELKPRKLDIKQKESIKNDSPKATETEDLLGKLPNKLPNNLEATYRAICEYNNATNQEIANRTNQAEGTVRNHIEKLKELNYIKRIGSKKTGHWEIVK